MIDFGLGKMTSESNASRQRHIPQPPATVPRSLLPLPGAHSNVQTRASNQGEIPRRRPLQNTDEVIDLIEDDSSSSSEEPTIVFSNINFQPRENNGVTQIPDSEILLRDYTLPRPSHLVNEFQEWEQEPDSSDYHIDSSNESEHNVDYNDDVPRFNLFDFFGGFFPTRRNEQTEQTEQKRPVSSVFDKNAEIPPPLSKAATVKQM